MSKIKILIVEDEPIIAADLRNQLNKLDYLVSSILESGEEAIDFVREKQPDVILMDIQLAGEMDGIEAAMEISKSHSIPIIFLTSNVDPTTFKRAQSANPNSFLSKPFRITDLIHSIELALSEKVEMNSSEEPFLQNLTKLIQQNLSNTDFSIEFICKSLGISRSQLHRKIKDETGLSTSLYIRKIKIEYGKNQLI